ncbi:MAG: caspase family protein [Actinomycetota bacterium]|nr:caspase family protein [Actinomycetota bacterium]
MAKYSLHIGVNVTDRDKYPEPFDDLSGAVPDACSLERLSAAQGFQTRRLDDSSATAEAVLSELRSYGGRLSAGDLLFLTYSGHGSQYADRDNDEPDHRDETWVLHDRQLLDDELRHAWSWFPRGACVLLLSDSCHSGTVLRLNRKVTQRNGDTVPQAGSARSRDMPARARDRDFSERSALYRGIKAAKREPTPESIDALVLQFGACRDNEVAYESAGQGVMTKAFIDVFADGRFEGDHTDFFNTLSGLVAQREPRQHPTFVTYGPDDLDFSGRVPLKTVEES